MCPTAANSTTPTTHTNLSGTRALTDDVSAQLAAEPTKKFVLCGDFNVAPLDEDVWDMEAFAGATHVSAAERKAFDDLLGAGLTEVTTAIHPRPGRVYLLGLPEAALPRRRRGCASTSSSLQRRCAQATGAEIDREERKGKGTSDHAPVIVDYDV